MYSQIYVNILLFRQKDGDLKSAKCVISLYERLWQNKSSFKRTV
mgnify:CR=1 FL=1|jgi:hypothetical protein